MIDLTELVPIRRRKQPSGGGLKLLNYFINSKYEEYENIKSYGDVDDYVSWDGTTLLVRDDIAKAIRNRVYKIGKNNYELVRELSRIVDIKLDLSEFRVNRTHLRYIALIKEFIMYYGDFDSDVGEDIKTPLVDCYARSELRMDIFSNNGNEVDDFIVDLPDLGLPKMYNSNREVVNFGKYDFYYYSIVIVDMLDHYVLVYAGKCKYGFDWSCKVIKEGKFNIDKSRILFQCSEERLDYLFSKLDSHLTNDTEEALYCFEG